MSSPVLNPFAMNPVSGQLPAALVDFTAQPEGPAAVHLTWTTMAPAGNAGFTVERSADARTFAAIGTVPGAGTSRGHHYYALLDDQLPGGTELLHYRLRQETANGAATYSPVCTVSLPPVLPPSFRPSFVVYPNPARAGHLLTAAGLPAETMVEVLDMLGQRVTTAATDATGIVRLALSAGVYVVRGGPSALRLTVE